MAPLAKKLHDAPLSLVLEYALGPMNVDEKLRETKQKGYCLSRHLAVAHDFEDDSEGPLAHALACAMQIQRNAMKALWEALSIHAPAAGSIRWHGVGESRIRFDVCSAELRRRSVTAFDSRACIEHSRMAMCGGTTTYLMGALPGGARATHLVSSPSGSPPQQPKTHH